MSEISGWLLMQNMQDGGFDKQWFVLSANDLHMFDDNPAATPDAHKIGEIILDDCSVEIAPEGKFKNCFELTAPAQSKVYVLVAENGTNLQDWMNAIRRAMLRIRRKKAKSAREQENVSSTTSTTNETDTIVDASTTKATATATTEEVVVDDYSQYITNDDDGIDDEDEDKYDVYRKWLEETNNVPSSHSSDHSLQYLLQEDKNNKGMCDCCVIV